MVSGQSCEYLPFVDGCSHSPNFIKKFMAKACVRHDLCYGCFDPYCDPTLSPEIMIFTTLNLQYLRMLPQKF
uniref:Uncharacterized protein n=1 Tax=Magallana gigas TaxID=29159 RepID=K1R070_MAGGI